jgi:hypothetical protein
MRKKNMDMTTPPTQPQKPSGPAEKRAHRYLTELDRANDCLRFEALMESTEDQEHAMHIDQATDLLVAELVAKRGWSEKAARSYAERVADHVCDMSDKLKKSSRTVQEAHRAWIEFIEMLCDCVDSEKSFEEFATYLEISAADDGAIPKEALSSFLEIARDALEEITKARKAGLNRSEVLAYMGAGAKP